MYICCVTSSVWTCWVWTKTTRPRFDGNENEIRSRFDSIAGSLRLHPFTTCSSADVFSSLGNQIRPNRKPRASLLLKSQKVFIVSSIGLSFIQFVHSSSLSLFCSVRPGCRELRFQRHVLWRPCRGRLRDPDTRCGTGCFFNPAQVRLPNHRWFKNNSVTLLSSQQLRLEH